MAASRISIPKIRFDLAIILERNGFDIHKTIAEVIGILELDDGRTDCLNSLISKIQKYYNTQKVGGKKIYIYHGYYLP